MLINREACTGCGLCVTDCPTGAITIIDEKALIGNQCVDCGVCFELCPSQAVVRVPADGPRVECQACPVLCRIPIGYMGACRRYQNLDGQLRRTVKLVVPPRKRLRWRERETPPLPLVTAIGAGTTRPDAKPAPFIVQEEVDEVDVVTVVSETPLSYSSVRVKIDTDLEIGEEGATVLRDNRPVGMVVTEEYGSKMLSIGGINRLSGRHGFTVARTIVDIANKEPVELKVRGGNRIVIQVGEAPIVEGRRAARMRVGCGSATIGLFARELVQVADEVIVIDAHITGLLSEHPDGIYAGAKPSGAIPKGRRSTPGRYFGIKAGSGWGGTEIQDPADIVASIDPRIAKPGMTLLVLEATGERAAMFRLNENYGLDEMPLTPQAHKVTDLIARNCQRSRVSALYVGGAGGSARAGVTSLPLGLTEAIHQGVARLTVGGAPAFIYPGGGITFAVDVERVPGQAFSWIPTPATVAPIEYTMERKVYEEMGGHVEYIRPLKEVLAEVQFVLMGESREIAI